MGLGVGVAQIVGLAPLISALNLSGFSSVTIPEIVDRKQLSRLGQWGTDSDQWAWVGPNQPFLTLVSLSAEEGKARRLR